MKRSVSLLALLGLVSCGRESTSTRPLTGDPGQPNCGFDLAPTQLVGDACTDGVPVVAPSMFERTNGPPNEFTRTFTVAESGTLCIQVLNGTGRTADPVNSARVYLDETIVLDNSSFGQGGEASRERVSISAGVHTLRVRLMGGPGGTMTVAARFAAVAPPEPTSAPLALNSPYASPHAFSPDGNGVFDESTLRVTIDTTTALPGNSSPNHTFELRNASFEIADAVTCQPVITLSQPSLPITPGLPTVLSASWDGVDSQGAIVAPGEYYFRAVGTLFRVSPNTRRIAESQSLVSTVVVIDDAPPGTQEEGVTVRVHPPPHAVPYEEPSFPSMETLARQRLQESAVEIDIALRVRLASKSTEMIAVTYSTGAGTAPYHVGVFQVLDTWKTDGSVSGTVTYATPATADAPNLVVGQEYAMFAMRGTTRLFAIDNRASLLPYVSANRLLLMSVQFSESEVRALTLTGGSP